MKKIIKLNVSRAVFHDILHYNLQPDSAAVAGRGALLPRLDSRQGAEDVRTRAGSRKGEMIIESVWEKMEIFRFCKVSKSLQLTWKT